VYFQIKNPNLSKFWRALEWKSLVYSVVIWYNLWPFGTCYGHLVHFVAIWYMLWPFGTFCGYLVILCQFGTFPPFWYIVSKTSGNPTVGATVPPTELENSVTKHSSTLNAAIKGRKLSLAILCGHLICLAKKISNIQMLPVHQKLGHAWHSKYVYM
jgi:hypothetical protein